jgi:hypothetical protein
MEQDVKVAYNEGVNSYLVKPPTTAELVRLMQQVKDYWFSVNEPPLGRPLPCAEC